MTDHASDIVLTEEQQAVVDLPWDAKCLAVAGAGAGKTLTLVRRLDALVERDDLLPGEILVLSFSRAAVRELRERLARHAVSAERVRAQTFDGWATAVLSRVAPEGEWTSVPFDERIRNATEAIEDGLLDEFFTEDLAHVVIDEVQDLVGDRSRMVEALLDHYREAGFTVVGDPAQSVYGFQVPLEDRAAEVNGFFPWLRNSFQDELRQLRLTYNFRAAADGAKIALPFGERLQDDGMTVAGHVEVQNSLRAELLRAFEFFPLDSGAAAAALSEYPGTCAVLCATNGQVLSLSRTLRLAGVPHRVQRAADDRVLPAWVARLFARNVTSSLPRSKFDDTVPELTLLEGALSDVLWQSLVHLDGRGHRSGVDLNRVKNGLAAGPVPDELSSQSPSRILLSTVHRVKGLEFDRVVVVVPEASVMGRPDADPSADARVLYVAMTRARQEVYHLSLARDWYLRKDSGRYATDRWYRGGTRARRGQRYSIEVLGGDVSRAEPAGVTTSSATDIQQYLWDVVRPGDAVEFVRMHDLPGGERESPPYELRHRGRPIGTASEPFRKALYAFRKTARDAYSLRWPKAITDLFIDSVETVVGDDQAAQVAGIGDRGVWLAPRPVGLGRLVWDQQGTEDGEA